MKFAAAAAPLLLAPLAGARALKSKSGSKASKSKAKAGKSTAAPTPTPPCAPDLQEGFDCGMDPLSVGLWGGEGKYHDGERGYDYCCRALWNPTGGGNFLTWDDALLGMGGEGEPTSCADIGMDPLEKTINGAWLPMLKPSESYILNVEQVKCLPADDCDYDVLANGDLDFPGFAVKARACSAHLKIYQMFEDTYSCELTQFSLLEDGDGRQELVAVLSYSEYHGGHSNYTCPMKPAYGMQAAMDDPNMAGNGLFVLQANDLNDVSFNTTNWHCPNLLGD